MQSLTGLSWPCSTLTCPDNQLTSVWHSSLLCTLLWFYSKEKQRHLLLFLVIFSFPPIFPVLGTWTKSVSFHSFLLEGNSFLTSVSCLYIPIQFQTLQTIFFGPKRACKEESLSVTKHLLYIYSITEIWQCYSCITHCIQII